MSDRPNDIANKPSSVFRETYLRHIELPAAYAALRAFGEVLCDLSFEGSRAVMLPRGGKVAGTYFTRFGAALLLDLDAIRSELKAIAEQVGEGENLEDNRLAIELADLRPRVEEVAGTLRAALERAAGSPAGGGGEA